MIVYYTVALTNHRDACSTLRQHKSVVIAFETLQIVLTGQWGPSAQWTVQHSRKLTFFDIFLLLLLLLLLL